MCLITIVFSRCRYVGIRSNCHWCIIDNNRNRCCNSRFSLCFTISDTDRTVQLAAGTALTNRCRCIIIFRIAVIVQCILIFLLGAQFFRILLDTFFVLTAALTLCTLFTA